MLHSRDTLLSQKLGGLLPPKKPDAPKDAKTQVEEVTPEKASIDDVSCLKTVAAFCTCSPSHSPSSAKTRRLDKMRTGMMKMEMRAEDHNALTSRKLGRRRARHARILEDSLHTTTPLCQSRSIVLIHLSRLSACSRECELCSHAMPWPELSCASVTLELRTRRFTRAAQARCEKTRRAAFQLSTNTLSSIPSTSTPTPSHIHASCSSSTSTDQGPSPSCITTQTCPSVSSPSCVLRPPHHAV